MAKAIHRDRGTVPGCIMLPESAPDRTIEEVRKEQDRTTAAFVKRVQKYLKGNLPYEEVW
jgi:hypothetical protein